jgi:hypothetical protein
MFADARRGGVRLPGLRERRVYALVELAGRIVRDVQERDRRRIRGAHVRHERARGERGGGDDGLARAA